MRTQIRTQLSKKPLIATLLGAALTALSLGVAVPVQADDALNKYAGNYVYAKDKAHGEAIIEKALDEALSQLNTVMKLMAKKALEASGRGPQFNDKILIEVPGGQIGLKIGEHEKVVLAKDKPTKMTREGRTGTVTHHFKGGKLIQTIEGEDGKLTNTFGLASDGKTLHRDVKIESPRMKKPIQFRLTYVRR